MASIDDWAGLVTSRSDDFDALWIVTPHPGEAGDSWSKPFKVAASDKADYWVKCLDTCPADQQASLASEMIVAKVGELIGAPVCKASLIRINADVAGWEAKPGVPLTEGLAHATLALEHCDEGGRPSLASRSQDDNSRRHAGIYALYDWCWGNDPQWLYDVDADRALYSHDHGLYFPPGGSGNWQRGELLAKVGDANQLPDPATGVLPAAVDEIATALESVQRSTLVDILTTVPASWPVDNADLEALGWFLEERAPSVATRLRALV